MGIRKKLRRKDQKKKGMKKIEEMMRDMNLRGKMEIPNDLQGQKTRWREGTLPISIQWH